MTKEEDLGPIREPRVSPEEAKRVKKLKKLRPDQFLPGLPHDLKVAAYCNALANVHGLTETQREEREAGRYPGWGQSKR